MKRNLIYFMGVFIISVASCSFTNKTFNNPEKDKLLIELVSYVLEKGHFDPKDINDDFSEHVFENFINDLDPFKRLFLESDIKEFEKYRFKIDDQIKKSEITFFNVVYNRMNKRQEEAKSIYKDVLAIPFNYKTDETISVDYKSQPYATSKSELAEKWRKQLKFSTLDDYAYMIDEEKKKKEKDDSYEMKSLDEIEKETREKTTGIFDEYFYSLKDVKRKDVFSQYVNAIVEEFDPHTNYLAPRDKEAFDTRISGKYHGIGARLQKRFDAVKITEVISGGPVWRDKKIVAGDQILKVAQGDEEPVEISNMSIDDAIKLIKGPKGTEVRLTLKRIDGTIEVIPVIRDVVELEESYAKSSVVKKGNRKFGIINLPQFYVDFDDYKERNAATDVAKEITRLKSEGMEGLVLDLRGNGGGSLKTVVDMGGLFIENGPIVQVRSTGREKEVLNDEDKRIQWDGPLVILVDEFSASASEILAAAMQDYKRAIVIGSKQTYGKGTVQNVIDLNRFLSGDHDFGNVGALKVTTQKFYRINGGSTQLEGVKSDIAVPDRYSYIDIGEKDQENPLPWDKIAPANYEPWDGYIDYESTIAKSKGRMATNSQLALIDENAKWVKEQSDDNDYSLNYETFKAERDENDKRADYFKKIRDYKTNLSFSSLPYELELFKNDNVLKERRERWYEDLAKDVYVEEAINVLEDLQINNIRRGKVAGIKG
ncbi:tail-specific protease [Flavobacteriaceae bacterium R38]|nr:tail-specific protease [Flavobacteriaceae bacterium R38]